MSQNTPENSQQLGTARWTEAEVNNLIDLWQEREVLWQPTHPNHIRKDFRDDAIREIAESLHRSPEEVLKKIHTLQTQLSREKSLPPSGSAAKKPWKYLERLAFLIQKNTPRGGIGIGLQNEVVEEGGNDAVSSEF